MKRIHLTATLHASAFLAASAPAGAGQAPGKDSDPDVPVSHRDRVYAAEQFSNTVSVTDRASPEAGARLSMIQEDCFKWVDGYLLQRYWHFSRVHCLAHTRADVIRALCPSR